MRKQGGLFLLAAGVGGRDAQSGPLRLAQGTPLDRFKTGAEKGTVALCSEDSAAWDGRTDGSRDHAPVSEDSAAWDGPRRF